jgi:hypothetical protein
MTAKEIETLGFVIAMILFVSPITLLGAAAAYWVYKEARNSND